MNAVVSPANPSPADYASDQQVRWCPGCGDYAILKGIQRTLAELAIPREQLAFVSGIGCSSRLPYYLETYGFHTIHGRAPAFATGIKLTNPALDVWVITGDGDGLSIGGNHLLHALRRNVNLQILLFNNEIYGLTKGQYSPTSRMGTRSPSTPFGSVDAPLLPAAFALGAGARFVARAIDKDQRRLPSVLARAHDHPGASFVEIFQNCIVYNDDTFASFAGREHAASRQIHVQHGAPLVFGVDGEKGLRLDAATATLEIVDRGDVEAWAEVLVHDEKNPVLAGLLAALRPPAFPLALGVLYCNPGPVYRLDAPPRPSKGDIDPDESLNRLLRKGTTWVVEP